MEKQEVPFKNFSPKEFSQILLGEEVEDEKSVLLYLVVEESQMCTVFDIELDSLEERFTQLSGDLEFSGALYWLKKKHWVSVHKGETLITDILVALIHQRIGWLKFDNQRLYKPGTEPDIEEADC